jgi:hypothetical protein
MPIIYGDVLPSRNVVGYRSRDRWNYSTPPVLSFWMRRLDLTGRDCQHAKTSQSGGDLGPDDLGRMDFYWLGCCFRLGLYQSSDHTTNRHQQPTVEG